MVARIKLQSRSVGQPTRYIEAYVKTCAFLAARGATIAEMASACSVNTSTFYRWMNIHPELHDAVTSAKIEMFNPRVERALAERALGYTVDVEEVTFINGKEVRYTVRKHYPPDVTAGIYWTKNQQPDKWRDVHRQEVAVAGLKSSEELRQLLALEFKDLIDQGLLALPAPMKEINPKGSGA